VTELFSWCINCPKHDRIFVFGVDPIAGEDRVGVGVGISHIISGNFLILFAAGFEHDQIGSSAQGHEHRAGVNDRRVAGAAFDARSGPGRFAIGGLEENSVLAVLRP
jgi:hypothetical protein